MSNRIFLREDRISYGFTWDDRSTTNCKVITHMLGLRAAFVYTVLSTFLTIALILLMILRCLFFDLKTEKDLER